MGTNIEFVVHAAKMMGLTYEQIDKLVKSLQSGYIQKGDN